MPSARRKALLRKLRIAWSIGCVLAVALLIALWVRSYTWGDAYHQQAWQRHFGGSTLRGLITLHLFDVTKREKMETGYTIGHAENHVLGDDIQEPFLGCHFYVVGGGHALTLPMWLFIIASAVGAVIPWLNWRQFSLRTLLVIMSLFAALLGLIVYLSSS